MTNAVDKLLVKQIQAKPWREISLCGASITERIERVKIKRRIAERSVIDMHLAWVEKGQVGDEYHAEICSDMCAEDLTAYLKEIVAFARGAIPVAWGTQSKALLHIFLKEWGELMDQDPFFDVDTTLCFLLRPASRWLDPMIWSRVRTGKFHELEVIMKAVGLVRSHSKAIDVAALAYQLPTRPGFPVKPDWTASATAEWQELQRIF